MSVDLQRNRVLDGSGDDRLDVKVFPGADPDPTTGRMGHGALAGCMRNVGQVTPTPTFSRAVAWDQGTED